MKKDLVDLKSYLIFVKQTNKWSHRLPVRTPGFHPGNRGSIPRGTTNIGVINRY